jgi:hypothetical protein
MLVWPPALTTPEASLPKILAQVLGKFFPDVPGTHRLQITNKPE